MLIQQTREHLSALKLTGLLQALEEQLEKPAMSDLGFEERLAMLIDREVLYRENRRLERLLRVAKLRVTACAEDIDYRHPQRIGEEPHGITALAGLDTSIVEPVHHRPHRLR